MNNGNIYNFDDYFACGTSDCCGGITYGRCGILGDIWRCNRLYSFDSIARQILNQKEEGL